MNWTPGHVRTFLDTAGVKAARPLRSHNALISSTLHMFLEDAPDAQKRDLDIFRTSKPLLSP